MEQTAVNGGAVWDGPELIWTEDFRETDRTTVDGYTRRNWTTFEGFRGAWIDMFRKIIDGTLYIPTREEVINKTKIVVIQNVNSGSDEDKYAAWGDLYTGLYKQTDPFNKNDGNWMNNYCYFKSTGRYGAVPICLELADSLAKTIPLKLNKSVAKTRWSSQKKKLDEFNQYYPEVSTGDLYVNRYRNQLVTYTPYTYLNTRTTATGHIPLQYNTCDSLHLTLGKLGSALVREYADHIDFYFNNFRTDTTTLVTETIVITGATAEPTFELTRRLLAKGTATGSWDAETGTYTLTLKHLGGIDLRLSCTGAGEDRSTDPLPSTALTANPPVQPAPYHGEIQIEAEDMDFKSVKNLTTSPYNTHPNVIGHAGNGFVCFFTKSLFCFICIIDRLPACSQTELCKLKRQTLGDISGILKIVISDFRENYHVSRSLDAETVISDALLQFIPYCTDVELKLCADLIYEIALFFFIVCQQLVENSVFYFSVGEAPAGVSLFYYIIVVFHVYLILIINSLSQLITRNYYTIRCADFQ